MKQNRDLNQNIFIELEERIGREHLSQRLRLQVERASIGFQNGKLNVHWEYLGSVYSLLKILLISVGLYRKGQQNTLDYKIEKNVIPFHNLPKDFHNFRILQLSDIHVDKIIDQGKQLQQTIDQTDFDLCVITGDFRFSINGEYKNSCKGMARLIDSLQCKHGVYGILGNHDYIETVPYLEDMGITLFLNEAIRINQGDSDLWLAGVDDDYFYQCHDLPRTFRDIPESSFTILLSHSPTIIKEAAKYGPDLYLCGHTHGGQICLPNGIPIITNTANSRKYASGPWQYSNMVGYTSRGTGSSGLQVRFQCPPEITLHQLVIT